MRLVFILSLVSLLVAPSSAQTSANDPGRSAVQVLGDGSWRTIDMHPNGVVAERGTYLRSKRSGTWTAYDASGRLTHEARFSRGEKDGIWRVYAPNGSVLYEIRYDMGERVEAIAYAAP